MNAQKIFDRSESYMLVVGNPETEEEILEITGKPLFDFDEEQPYPCSQSTPKNGLHMVRPLSCYQVVGGRLEIAIETYTLAWS